MEEEKILENIWWDLAWRKEIFYARAQPTISAALYGAAIKLLFIILFR